MNKNFIIKTTSFFFIVVFYKLSLGQINLISNQFFLNGNYQNCKTINGLDNWVVSMPSYNFNVGMDPWWIKKETTDCENICSYFYNGGLNEDGRNTWRLLNSFNPNQFVFIRFYAKSYNKFKDKYSKPNYHNCIGQGLSAPLKTNTTYILRFKYIPLSTEIINKTSGRNHLRVHLTSKLQNWKYYNSDNEIDISTVFEPQGDCVWKQKESVFMVSKNNLKNIIFFVEEGAFAIYDIELFEKCPWEIAIQNKKYFATHNYPIKEQASEILYAGRDVTGNWAQGDVIVQNNADVHFTAGQKIVIVPGFKTELGAKFIAEITPCANSSSQRIINSENINEEYELENQLNNSFIEIYPNPTNGQFTVEIPDITENSNLKIYNTYGQLMLQQQINSNPTQIDLSGFEKGIYFVRFQTKEQECFVEKLVLQ